MVTATRVEPALPDLLRWEQICERYPAQYVCIVDVAYARFGASFIHAARVVNSGPTRRAALAGTESWLNHERPVSCRFTGPSDHAVIIRRFPRLVITDEIRELLRAGR